MLSRALSNGKEALSHFRNEREGRKENGLLAPFEQRLNNIRSDTAGKLALHSTVLGTGICMCVHAISPQSKHHLLNTEYVSHSALHSNSGPSKHEASHVWCSWFSGQSQAGTNTHIKIFFERQLMRMVPVFSVDPIWRDCGKSNFLAKSHGPSFDLCVTQLNEWCVLEVCTMVGLPGI